MLILVRSGPQKTNSLFNLIILQSDIDKIYLNSKDPYEAKYHFNYSKAFIEYSNYLDDTYKSIEKYNPNKNRKILIVLDDMIADMLTKKRKNQ